MSIVEFVRKQIVDHRMIAAGERVLAACSGGCDSMTLVHILHLLQDELKFRLAAANVNHMLRPEAEDEAVLVGDFCSRLKIPYYHQSIDIPFFKKESGLSCQDAARRKRYEYLRDVAKRMGGAKIATGHHRDDQAETVLLHLLRGSGSGGLSGMKPCADNIIRPLFWLKRTDLENYCAGNNIPFSQDMSNFEADYLRNRIRLKLIPQLEMEYNNKVRETLVKTAEIISAENDFVSKAALSAWEKVIAEAVDKAQTWYLDIGQFNKLHLAVKRELIRQVFEKKMGKLRGIGFAHIEALINLAANGRVGAVLTLPCPLLASKTYSSLVFTKKADAAFEGDKPDEPSRPVFQIIEINSLTQIPELEIEVSLKIHSSYPDILPDNAASFTAVFDYDGLEPPFLLRTRLPGDRFAPSGMSGNKKLKDFFIDKKVLQKKRDFVPLILDQKGIIWVAGYRRANRGQVTSDTKNFLQITINKRKGI